MNGKGKIPKNRFQAIAKKYPLYLAIAGVAVSFIFSLENYAFEKGMVNFNVMDTYIYAVEMSGKNNNNDFRNTFIYHVFTATASLDI